MQIFVKTLELDSPPRPKVKLAVLQFYKVDDSGKVQRLRKECPNAECGAGTFMANHFDRHYCVMRQIIGVHDKAEKDEIVKSVMHLKNAEIEVGYTKDADLLVDVRDKLLFETEYAVNFKDKQQLNLLIEFLGLGCLVLCAFFRGLATYGIHVFYCFNLVYMLTQLSGGLNLFYKVLSNVEDKLQKLLIGLGSANNVLGIQVCAYKDGEVIIDTTAGVLGRYDPRPAQPDSLFPVFSLSKGITV
ncbi:hypothetical protein OROMI_021331 [Orobanche minor]